MKIISKGHPIIFTITTAVFKPNLSSSDGLDQDRRPDRVSDPGKDKMGIELISSIIVPLIRKRSISKLNKSLIHFGVALRRGSYVVSATLLNRSRNLIYIQIHENRRVIEECIKFIHGINLIR